MEGVEVGPSLVQLALFVAESHPKGMTRRTIAATAKASAFDGAVLHNES
jgi:hypothetical protein